MSKYRITGEPSAWEHFDQIHEILKESKLVNLSLCMNERFGKEHEGNQTASCYLIIFIFCFCFLIDFSPMDDSDSNDSTFWANNDDDPPKTGKIEDETEENPDSVPPIEGEFICSAKIKEPATEQKTQTVSERILAIEEAKLQVQRKKLKVMKTIADELSSIHRDFLKAYRNK